MWETVKDVWDEMKRAMFNGLSYMIPLVAGGGILIAIGTFIYALSGKDMEVFNTYMYNSGNVHGDWAYLSKEGWMAMGLGNLDRLIFWLGKIGFYVIPEFMSAFTAYALVGKPGIAPGFVLGYLANKMGGNFLGAIVTGWMAGYLVRFTVQNMRLKGGLQTVTSFVFVPIMATMIGGILYRFTIGAVITEIMDALLGMLESMHSDVNKRVLMATIMGAMVVSDLGGPIGKVSVLFGLGVIGTDLYPHTFNHVAIPTSGAVLFLSWAINRKAFNDTARQAVISNQINCFFTVTEGGLPFLFQKPHYILPATMTAGAIAAAMVAIFEIQLQVPLGFWLAIPFVSAGNAAGATLQWILAFGTGVLVGTAILTLILRIALLRNGGEEIFLDEDSGFVL